MKHTLIVPPNFYAMMTGATTCRKYSDRAELQYEDGSTESASLSHPMMQSVDWGSWFSIVGCIQSAARG